MSISTMILLKKVILFSGIIISIVQCATSPGINTTVPAEAALLDEKFRINARVGALPLNISDPESKVLRYSLQAPGMPPEFLIILLPNMINGEIKIPITERPENTESAFEFIEYLDDLLRSHRQMLRGELSDSLKTLDKIDLSFGPTYGTLVIRGHLSLLQRRYKESKTFFQRARRIYPKFKQLLEGAN